MDIIYRKGEVTAADVVKLLPDPLSNSCVRTQLRVLEKKGFIRHREQGLRYVYYPAHKLDNVKHHALEHLIQTFFNGSPEKVIAALLHGSDRYLTGDELDRIASLIKKAKKEGE